MHPPVFYDESEKPAMEREAKQVSRSFRILVAALFVFSSVVMAEATAAQDSNHSATAQQSPDAATHGVYKVGGDVSAPVLIHSVEPESADVAGTVQVTLWVDSNGNPGHVRVTRGLGMGLDLKALEAVKQYKYKPAMKDGRPVMVELNVEVKFQRPVH